MTRSSSRVDQLGRRGEHGVGLVELAQVAQGVGVDAADLDARSGRPRCLADATGEGRVVDRHRLAGGGQQQLGFGPASRLEPPGGQAQQIAAPLDVARLQRIGQRAEHVACAQRADVGPEHLAEQRVIEPRFEAPVVGADVDESLPLDRLDGLGPGQPLEHVDGHRLAEGDELDRLGFGGIERAEPLLDQIGQPFGDVQRADQRPPTLGVLGQRPALDGAEDQLAQGQRVPPTDAAQLDVGRGADALPERLVDEPIELVLAQRLHVDPQGVTVLPELEDGVADVLTGAHGGEHEHLAIGGDLQDERRRGVVEQVGVVDQQHQALVAGRGRAALRGRCRAS